MVSCSDGSSCPGSDDWGTAELELAVGLVFCVQLGHTKTAHRHARRVRKDRMDKGIVLFLKAIVGGLPLERLPRLFRTIR